MSFALDVAIKSGMNAVVYLPELGLDGILKSVQAYKSLLNGQNLLPGRRILRQDLDERFALLERAGIHTVAHLKKSLSTTNRIEALAAESGIPEDYLVILRREIGSLEQKPVPLSSFPGIDPMLIVKLANANIQTSKEYWEKEMDEADELFCLCDLVRINGVGPAAAKAFFETGYRSVSDVAAADAGDMLNRISAANEARHYYKAKLGVKDMQFCIDFAVLLIKHTA